MKWDRTQLRTVDINYYVENDIDMVLEEMKYEIERYYGVDLDDHPDWFGDLRFKETEYYRRIKNDMITDFFDNAYYEDDMTNLFDLVFSSAAYYIEVVLNEGE